MRIYTKADVQISLDHVGQNTEGKRIISYGITVSGSMIHHATDLLLSPFIVDEEGEEALECLLGFLGYYGNGIANEDEEIVGMFNDEFSSFLESHIQFLEDWESDFAVCNELCAK